MSIPLRSSRALKREKAKGFRRSRKSNVAPTTETNASWAPAKTRRFPIHSNGWKYGCRWGTDYAGTQLPVFPSMQRFDTTVKKGADDLSAVIQ
jgi:hypothetical protein